MDQNKSQQFDDAQMRGAFHDLHIAIVSLRDHARLSGDLDQAAELWRNALSAGMSLEGLGKHVDSGSCLDQLALGLEELEASARAFFRNSGAKDDETARRCAVLRAVSRLLLRMAREIEERQARDETPFLIQELRDIDNALDGDALTPDDESERLVADNALIVATKAKILVLRANVLAAQATQQIAAAKEITTCHVEDAYRVFRLSRALAASSFDLVASGDQQPMDSGKISLQELSLKLASESRRLREMFVEFLKANRETKGFDIAAESARWITGELDQARVDSYDDRSDDRIEKLRRLEEDGKAIALGMKVVAKLANSSIAPKGYEGGEAARRSYKKLERMVRRIGHVISDRILARRLDRAFGPAQVKRWEKLVFWLIMLVMLLIVVDHFGGPGEDLAAESLKTDPTTEQGWREIGSHIWTGIGWTIWVDTLICVVLLWDFMVRLVLSPTRLAYFRRNFITEFLPSLPFGLLHGLMAVDKLRFVRTARLVRVARVLRLARPVIRLLRLFLFLARAADRLVERNSWFLNQNIVFATEEEESESTLTLLSRARNIDSWVATKTSGLLKELPVEAQVTGAYWRMALIEAEFSQHDGGVAAANIRRKHAHERVRDLNVDVVVDNLRGLDDNQVAEMVGVEVAEQLTASLSFFRLPFLRRFAFARFLLGPSGAPDPLWTTARLGRLAGDALSLVARGVHWFADLYGTITGAQFLDRVGMQLVKATMRPAKRLIIVLVAVGLILALVWLTQIPRLIAAVSGISGVLGPAVIVLGLLCFIPLGLGIWLRRIAGQAVDFFDRVSEAQFFALTETTKERNAGHDVEYLVDRVLMPEHVVLTPHEEEETKDKAKRALMAVCRKDDGADMEASPLRWAICDAMMLYYRDFIDGAYFHKNDTKIANILVGNLTLENIRRNRLSFDAKLFKRLDRLDIGRNKGGISGPRVWFNFITHSVAQHTARLIIEYNQHCIPQDEYEAAEPEDRKIFDDWLARRKRISEARRRNEMITIDEIQPIDSTAGTLLYRTTEFNALNFLTKEEKRDESVCERFGTEVANLLVEDRENLIRDIFGTFPLQELPKSKRTFNPYRFYRRFLARGRVFAFPLVAVWFALKGLRLVMKRVVFIIKDVLNPNDRPLTVSAGRSGFEVARRKIHRMRRPVVMETVRIRALFDVEYLGIPIPGFDEETIRKEDLLVEDLRQLDASERDWESFRETKTQREKQIRILARFLREQEEAGNVFLEQLVAGNPHLVGREGQAMRVVATAFVCDYHGVYSVLDAIGELQDLVQRLPEEQKRWLRYTRSKKTLERVQKYWHLFASENSDERLMGTLAMTLDRRHRASRTHLDSLDEFLPPGVTPEEYVWSILLKAAEKPSSWCEQTIAVRTVQSLGMLDLKGYETVIRELGGYEDEESSDLTRDLTRRL